MKDAGRGGRKAVIRWREGLGRERGEIQTVGKLKLCAWHTKTSNLSFAISLGCLLYFCPILVDPIRSFHTTKRNPLICHTHTVAIILLFLNAYLQKQQCDDQIGQNLKI